MNSWHSYPKIFNVGHKYLASLFADEVVVQEKVDGSQFSFGLFGDRLLVRSKGVEMDAESPEKMFSIIVDYVKSIKDKLVDGHTYRGEYLAKKSHNTLCYDRVPAGNFVLFDIEIAEQDYAPHDYLVSEAARLGFDVIPQLWSGHGKDLSIEKLKGMMDRMSFLGGVKIEGLVVKNYHQYGPDKKALFGKIVSDDFKEAHGEEWSSKHPCPSDFYEQLGQRYRTTARWQKAVQHLKEQGLIDQAPADIAKLFKEINSDVIAECKGEMMEALFEHAWRKISKQLTVGMPEWYKEQLLKAQFEQAGECEAKTQP